MNDIKVDAKTEFRQEIPRSLRFPQVGLEICLEKIKILFAKNSTNAMSVEAIRADLGYAGQNGACDRMLAAIKYYGLLESIEGRYKIADFIIDYCLDEKLAGGHIKKCLFSVPVNRKIFSIYDIDNLPGNNEIKSFLIKECKYSVLAATTYTETFQKNLSMLNRPEMAIAPVKKSSERAAQNEPESAVLSNNIASSSWTSHDMLSYTHPLSNGTCIAIQLPSNINELDHNDLEDARDLLNLVLTKIERRVQHLHKIEN